MFYVRNESNTGSFYLSGKMGSACIAAENGQGAFLVAEKWTRCIFSYREMDKAHFQLRKNGQGVAPS